MHVRFIYQYDWLKYSSNRKSFPRVRMLIHHAFYLIKNMYTCLYHLSVRCSNRMVNSFGAIVTSSTSSKSLSTSVDGNTV